MENFEQNEFQFNNQQSQETLPPKTAFGGLGLGFGIASIVLFWIPVIGLILGILGVIFTILAKRVVGMRIAGAICSGIGTFLSLIITGLMVLGFAILGNIDNSVLLEQELNSSGAVVQIGEHELVGIWVWDGDGNEWYSFRADGTAVNLMDGEEFTWHENGTLNAIIYTSWEINGNTLTIHNSFGSSFNYHRR